MIVIDTVDQTDLPMLSSSPFDTLSRILYSHLPSFINDHMGHKIHSQKFVGSFCLKLLQTSDSKTKHKRHMSNLSS